MAINSRKDETKSDILNDIVTPFDFPEERRRQLTMDELSHIYSFLRGGKGDEMTTAEYRRALVKMAYRHADRAPPDNLDRYEMNNHRSCPGLTRPHAEQVRTLVEDTIDSQRTALDGACQW